MKITVLDGFLVGAGGVSWSPISSQGEMRYFDMTTENDDIAERIGDSEAVFTNRCPISAETLEKCGNVKFIDTFGTGYNHIDIEAASRLGVTVCNSPGYANGSVAQMAAALLLEICRRVSYFDGYVKNCGWEDPADPRVCSVRQIELTGKTLGIIGYGNIGAAFARIALSMDMNVLAFCRHPENHTQVPGVVFCGLDGIYDKSDVISLHCPLTPETRGMIGEKEIARMKDGVIIINTARGAVLNDEAVIKGLDSGKIYALGADVFSNDPCGRGDPLACHPRCVATPHVGWTPVDTREKDIEIGGDNLKAFLCGTPKNVVNG